MAAQAGAQAGSRKKAKSLIANERRRRRSSCSRSTRRCGGSSTTCATRACSTTPTSSSPPTTASSAGEHRIIGGKYLPYDPSSRVPLLIRGRGFRRCGQRRAGLAHGRAADDPRHRGLARSRLDGRSLLPYAQNPARALEPPDPARGRHRPGPRRRGARVGLGSEPRAQRQRQGAARRQEGRQGPRPGEGPDQVAEVRRQRQLRPRLQGDPHRPLPLRPLRQRPDRALRHELRPGPAALAGGQPAVQADPQVPLQRAGPASPPAPAPAAGSRSRPSRCPCRSGSRRGGSDKPAK